jgi:protein O-GlcNAc transferase
VRLATIEVLFSPADGPRGAGAAVAPAMLDKAVQQGLALHQRGRLQEAADAYNWVLAVDPEHAEANHLLGLALHQAGRHEDAARLIAKASRRVPGNAVYHANLGVVLKVLNRVEEAAQSYERSLRLDPKQGPVQSNLGVALLELGKAEAAVAAQQRALKLLPGHAEAHAGLGLALVALARTEEAIECYARAIALKPDYANAHNNLAIALASLGRMDAARQSAERAVALRPTNASLHQTLGGILMEAGRLEEAAASFNRALAIKPDSKTYRNLARLLVNLGRMKEASDALIAAITTDPLDAGAYAALGTVLRDRGNNEGAAEAYSKAIGLDPNDPDVHTSLGSVLLALGRIEEAEAAYRVALSLDPDNLGAKGPLMFASNYRETSSIEAIVADAHSFGAAAGRKIVPRTNFANVRDPAKRLRVGLVSGDFYAHPVARFLEGVLAAIDGEKLELFGYAAGPSHDATTERLKAKLAHWRPSNYQTDAQLEATIIEDGIDILVDLSGHTSHNRLLMFGRKPAPVTVTWLGYSGTTGLESMDYIIGDRFVAPPEAANQFTETIWPMPDSYLCFAPPPGPDVAPLPALGNGHVTFGSFNNVNKLSSATLALWARVLNAVPDSRLLLKGKPFEKPAVAGKILGAMRAAGADISRVDLVGFINDSGGHMGAYGRIDIGLDPFPYNGTTTTCEALFMGVPVLTVRGDRFIARVGESVLNSAGLADWVAAGDDDFVRQAAAMATDLPRLAALRAGLRAQMLASPLCDAPRCARHLELALRGMWTRWCEGNPARS